MRVESISNNPKLPRQSGIYSNVTNTPVYFTSNQYSAKKILKKLNNNSFLENLEIGFKKLIGLYDVHSKGSYKVRIPFLEPYNLTAEKEIEVGKLCKIRKNHQYSAPVVKIYGKEEGKINSKDVWLYPGSTAKKTAEIMTDELTVIGKIEQGANIFANKVFAFPQSEINASLHSGEIIKIGVGQ